MLCRPALCWIFFAFVAKRRDIGMAIKRVVIEIHLRIEGQQITFAGHHQRVDLQHGRVAAEHRVIKRREQLKRRFE